MSATPKNILAFSERMIVMVGLPWRRTLRCIDRGGCMGGMNIVYRLTSGFPSTHSNTLSPTSLLFFIQKPQWREKRDVERGKQKREKPRVSMGAVCCKRIVDALYENVCLCASLLVMSQIMVDTPIITPRHWHFGLNDHIPVERWNSFLRTDPPFRCCPKNGSEVYNFI